MSFLKLSKSKAFTLIELLVVVAIIGILTGIITANLAQSKAKARDAKRVSDIAQIQLALEIYFDRCDQYPSTLSVGAYNCSQSGITLESFISKIPTPPAGTPYGYYTSGNTDYVLYVTMETMNSALLDDVDGTPFVGVPCDDLIYCVRPH